MRSARARATVETLYLGAVLTPTERGRTEFLADGGLLVDRDGKILRRGPGPKLARTHPKARKVRFRSGSLLLPGLVDTHTHLPQYTAAGRFDLDLRSWLERAIYPLESRFADLRWARAASKAFFSQLIENGTTSAAVYTTVHPQATDAAFRAAQRSGIRAVIGKVMMDTHAPVELRERTDESLRTSLQLCRRWNGAANGRLRYAFTPRFAVTCSKRLMAGAARLAVDQDALIQTHLAENLEEVASVRALFPECRSYTEVYRDCGLVTPRTVFAHAIHLSPPEIAALTAGGSSIAHCPLSNLLLGSGLMDATARMEANLRVGLGSDVGCGPTLDLFQQMAAACYTSKVLGMRGLRLPKGRGKGGPITPDQALTMATLGGARALGLGGSIGSLEAGKSADFVVVDYAALDPDSQPPEGRPAGDLLSVLCYRGGGRAVRKMFVQGVCVGDKDSGTPQP